MSPRDTLRPARDARERRAWFALGITLITLIAVTDALLGARARLLELVLLGPLFVCIRLSGPATSAVAGYAVAAAIVLGFPNDIFGTLEHLLDILVVVLASGLAVAIARLRTRREAAEAERLRLFELESEARVRAERAERRSSVLADAAAVLSASLELDRTVANIARVAVPRLADWCFVDLLDDDGQLRRAAVAHVDPEAERRGWELERRYPTPMEAPAGAPKVVRTGEPELLSNIPAALMEAVAVDPQHLELMRAFAPRSAMTVPLRARGRILGALTLVSSDPDRRFGPDDLSLAEDVAARCSLAVDNARIYGERDYIARTLQQSLLPPLLPEVPGLELGARYRAAGAGGEVGGDFYDVFECGPDAWAVVVGDVRGKGAAAAAITGLARWTLRAAAMGEADPVAILRTLNDAMLRQDESGDRFCTVVYARLEPTADGGQRATIACGGHPLPFVLRAGGSVETAGRPGMLIGFDPDPPLESEQVLLTPGDALVLYTDGVPEARTEGRLLGQGRLRDVVAECQGEPADAIAGRIDAEAYAFAGDGLRDDVAVVVCRVPPVAVAGSARPGAGRPQPVTTS